VNSIGLPQFSPKIALLFTSGSSSTPRGRQIKKAASSIHSTSAGSFMAILVGPHRNLLHALLETDKGRSL
jgi:hypothetical protein